MRFPAIYIPHGGGPWPFVDIKFATRAAHAPIEAYLEGFVSSLPERPRAVLVVSAHWEEPVVTVMTAPRPPMLYDYYGFPPAAYEIQWPAPGAPALAATARALLADAGIASAEDPARGFDHGTFVPMKVAIPDADVPILQVSLLASLDPDAHLAVGRALAPLRDQGVLLVGSGNSFHNMRGFGQEASRAPSRRFDAWMRGLVDLSPVEREDQLRRWADAPEARFCHPREEHLLPLHVMAGAAMGDAASVPVQVEALSVAISGLQFG